MRAAYAAEGKLMNSAEIIVISGCLSGAVAHTLAAKHFRHEFRPTAQLNLSRPGSSDVLETVDLPSTSMFSIEHVRGSLTDHYAQCHLFPPSFWAWAF
jgi:hypothetical protein